MNYHNYQNSKLLYSPNTKQTLMHLFLFQYVRRVYTTAINFPCIHRNSHLGSSFLIKIGGGMGDLPLHLENPATWLSVNLLPYWLNSVNSSLTGLLLDLTPRLDP